MPNRRRRSLGKRQDDPVEEGLVEEGNMSMEKDMIDIKHVSEIVKSCVDTIVQTQKPKGNFDKNLIECVKYFTSQNIVFTGENVNDLRHFLTTVEETFVMFGIDKGQRLQLVSQVLRGKALEMFRSSTEEITTWGELKNSLISYYQPDHVQEGLKNKLRSMKMREGQSVMDFVQTMASKNQQLMSPYHEEKLVKIIIRQLSESAKTRMGVVSGNVCSLKQLIGLAQKHDDYYHEDRGGYSRSSAPKARNAVVNVDEESVEGENAIAAVSQPKRGSCYNCGQAGHWADTCGQAKKPKCGNCGLDGFTESNCIRCKKAKQSTSATSDVNMDELVKRVTEEVLKRLKIENSKN